MGDSESECGEEDFGADADEGENDHSSPYFKCPKAAASEPLRFLSDELCSR